MTVQFSGTRSTKNINTRKPMVFLTPIALNDSQIELSTMQRLLKKTVIQQNKNKCKGIYSRKVEVRRGFVCSQISNS